MANVLLLVLLIISIIMTGLILIQRSEGGALGIGGGGGGGGFMSGRSAANSVSRATAVLGTAFLACSLALSIVFNKSSVEKSILDESAAESALTLDVDSGEGTDPLASLTEEAATEQSAQGDASADPESPTDNEAPETPDATGDE